MLLPLHEALLRVALVPDASAAEGWDQVRDAVDPLADEGIRQLLPLVYRRLVDAGVGGPEVEALGRTVRETWLYNQLLFLDFEVAIDVLDAADVAHLALKGVPLALAHYPDVSLRPMADFDVLVAPESAPTAVDALRDAGWIIEWDLHRDFVARTCEVPCRPSGREGVLDLHWRLVPWVGRRWDASDPELWATARPLAVGRRTTLAPAPEDLLLHVVLHAFRSGWERVPRWAADVVMLLRSTEGSFDWDRFTARVLDGHVSLPIGDALGYAAGRLGAPVPGAVLDTLRSAPATEWERRAHRVASRPLPTERHWLYGEADSLLVSWSRTSVNYPPGAMLRSLPPFLRGRLRVDRLWAAPFVIARRRLRMRSRRPGRGPRARTSGSRSGRG